MAGVRSYSTEIVCNKERTAYWRDHVWTSVGEFDVRSGDDPFLASAMLHRVGELTVARVNASPHVLSRSYQQVRGDDRRLFKLVVQHEGTIFIEQRDKRVALMPGQWMLYDITRPFKFHTTEATCQSAVLLRAEDVRLADLTPYSLRACSAASGYSGMLRSALMLASAGNSSGASSGQSQGGMENDVGVMIARLARLALFEHGNHEARRSSHEVMRERIDGYLDMHLRRFDLSIDTVASGLNCSKRYLHKVFLHSGCTLSEYILNRRLEACRKDLIDPTKAGESVTDIAYACGFSSLAYFSRVFKNTYGESPSSYRALYGSMPLSTVQ